MFREVAEFHRAFGLPAPSKPTRPDADLARLRSKLLHEEWIELVEANLSNNIVEVADALADICYIAAGTAISYGIAPKDGEWLPSPLPPAHGAPGMQPKPIRESALDGLEAAMNAYDAAEGGGRRMLLKIGDALRGVMAQCWMISVLHSIPLQAVFDEVHRSNMAKLGPDGTPIRREDGKVLKPAGWTPPDIAGVLGKASNLWRHTRTGRLYYILSDEATDEATEARAVVYRSVADQRIWVRAYDVFHEEIEPGVGRFMQVTFRKSPEGNDNLQVMASKGG